MTDETTTTEEEVVTAGAVILHPSTGEVLDLGAATTTELADAVDDVAALVDRLGEFRQAIIDEVAGRMDRVNSRTEEVGDLVLKTNAPTTEVYNPHTLERELAPLVEDGVIEQTLLDRIIGWTRPPAFTPTKRVDGREVNKLKRSTDPRILRALAAARQVSPNKRTLKVERKDGER